MEGKSFKAKQKWRNDITYRSSEPLTEVKNLNLSVIKSYKTKAIKRLKELETKFKKEDFRSYKTYQTVESYSKRDDHVEKTKETEQEETEEAERKKISARKRSKKLMEKLRRSKSGKISPFVKKRVKRGNFLQNRFKNFSYSSQKNLRGKKFHLPREFKKSQKMIDTVYGKMNYEHYLHIIHPQSKIRKYKYDEEFDPDEIQENLKLQSRVRLKYRGDFQQKCAFRNNHSTGPLRFKRKRKKVNFFLNLKYYFKKEKFFQRIFF